ncbi:MAG: DUF6691 family protein [Aestuariivirga sp.]|uniref:DUF6691 family protein n=1 Tax=Aestuariivirga sp. TaxID=2650926 RepID=UPI0038CF7EE9
MDKLTAIVAGLLFGAGLTVSSMVNPMKVRNFLDVLGAWDPTLIFVLGGALAVTAAGYAIVLCWPKPLFADRFHLPNRSAIDPHLVGGAVIFGIGWGLSGFCPAPAIASLVFGYPQSFVFVAAMTLGVAMAPRLMNFGKRVADR